MNQSNVLLPNGLSNVVEVLRWRAVYQPEKEAYIFLHDGEQEGARLTYGQLDFQAQAIAALLQTYIKPGERVLLVYPAGLDFIVGFFGCLYAGAIAVPSYPPRLNQSLARLQAIVEDAQASVGLTIESISSRVKPQWSELLNFPDLHWIDTDKFSCQQVSTWQEPELINDTLAFLQYTSGSTGAAKGVMVSHGNLFHNLEYLKQAFGVSQESVSVSWLPNFHDMGLIEGIIQPLYTGFLGILMPPLSFVQKPVRWLQAITRYRGTHAGSPNFGYELCVKSITLEQKKTLDLSSWCNAYNGAEPIHRSTLESFAKAFESCGFRSNFLYPCYGMAEHTLMISGGNMSDEPIYCVVQADAMEKNRVVKTTSDIENVKHIVGCGHLWLDAKIVIVNPESLTQCAPDEIGEIWVLSSSVAKGYWNRPEQTEQTFQAYLLDSGEGPFMRTGDLGFLLDGEVFITGRLKDLIIIQGRNHYPQDIELTVQQSHSSLRPSCGAAFSVTYNNEEKLVVVQEVERSYLRKLDVSEVIAAVRRAVAQQYDLEVYAICLIKTATLTKTSSGKIQRSTSRVKFLEGTLDLVADWCVQDETDQSPIHTKVASQLGQPQPAKMEVNSLESTSSQSQQKALSQKSIEAWLISKVSEQMQQGTPNAARISSKYIDIRKPFADYGMSSLVAVRLSGELQEWLRCQLSPTVLYDYPTIESLAEYLAKNSEIKMPVFSDAEDCNRTNTAIASIAVIGMGCRFPGAKDCESFWELLHYGVDAIQEVPSSRWDIDALYEPTPASPGKMNTRWGGFLENVDQFDSQFFGISPREVEIMDPQQRLLLEVSWEALENAGQAPERLAGSQTGVFIGISNWDYSRLKLNYPATTDAFAGTGNALSIAANRLSYLLDLRGPSWAVDTACSSSLVALHQACQSLRQGECQLALAGGVNLILTPELTITFSQAQMLSPDGRCKTFDSSADGYVRGEGCGVVVLKLLSDALKDGDNILAVVRGSAVNQDGRSNGLTAPNGLSQQRVIHQALKNAGVTPAQISYVEAHGTGTSLGDPIEVNALKNVLLQERDLTEPCWVGSVKANIGHLEAAAGIAGFIKIVLSLQHKEIPPHLHLKQLNSQIHLEGTPLSIPLQSQPWLRGEKRRLAGVSSFGFGGTNAHVVLEEAPNKVQVTDSVKRPCHILTLSAKSKEALQSLARCYSVFLKTHPEEQLADICFTANTGRSHFDHRLVMIAESTQQLQSQLSAFVVQKRDLGLFYQEEKTNQFNKIVFLFTGQGSQYKNMGRQLYETQPTFKKNLDYCDEVLRPYLEHSLLSVIYPDTDASPHLDNTAYAQPALFALEYALSQLWISWGIKPDAVMGHSLGEYVAACIAGVFSLEDGLKLVAERGRLMQALPSDGEMVVIFADEQKVKNAIKGYESEVSIAAINNFQNVVISGKSHSVASVINFLKAQDIQVKKLKVSHAFHSPWMKPMLAAFEKKASEVNFSEPHTEIISNITGLPIDAEIATPNYWCSHVIEPVKFAASIEFLREEGYEIFLEIGSKPTLLGISRDHLLNLNTVDLAFLPSLSEEQGNWQQLMQTLGQLYLRGISVNWSALDADYTHIKLQLPTYPFQRKRYWLDKSTTTQQQKNVVFTNKPQTTIVELLNKGNTEQIVQILAQSDNFSQSLMTPSEVLKVLVQKHQEQLNQALISRNLFYRIEWQDEPRKLKTVERKVQDSKLGSWIIFSDPENLGTSLRKLLQERGEECFLVYATEVYKNLGDGIWNIQSSNLANWEDLFLEINSVLKLPVQGVIYLWSSGIQSTSIFTFTDIQKTENLGCNSVLSLVKMLVKHFTVLPKLWLVTREAALLGNLSKSTLAQASLSGLGRVIALEYPELWGGIVDLFSDVPADDATKILTEIEDSQGEDYIALRKEKRYVPRLISSQLPIKQLHLMPESTYLVTGGLGVLGLEVSQFMAEQGAKNLVLISRRHYSIQEQQILNKIEQLGTQVTLKVADICCLEDMELIVNDIKTSLPPLKGIIHAAGVIDDGMLLEQNWQRFEKVMLPKVSGSWNLHILTQDLALDFFVCFSSAVSLIGSLGQGNYAAANAFMDALMHYRQSLGKPGLSINWGPWQVGMAASLDNLHQSRLQFYGIDYIAPKQGLEILQQLLGQSFSQIGVMSIDWSAFSKQFNQNSSVPSILKLLCQTENQAQIESLSGVNQVLLDKIHSAEPKKRLAILTAYLQEEVGLILRLEQSELPNPQQGFVDMGMNSLMIVEFKNRLQTHLGRSLPSTVLFEYPSIKQLANYLFNEILYPPSDTADNSKTTAIQEEEQLSKNEIKASIEQELAKLETFLKDY